MARTSRRSHAHGTFHRSLSALSIVPLLTAGLFLFLFAGESQASHPTQGPAPLLMGANAYLDGVCEKSGTSPLTFPRFWNQTAAAADADGEYAETVLLADDFTDTGSDNVTFGMRYPFTGIRLKITTAAASGSVSWKYWSGSGWANLPLRSDLSNGFHNIGESSVTWTPPTDWKARHWQPGYPPWPNPADHYCDDRRQLYWVMAHSEQNYNVQPIATQVNAIIPNVKVKVVTELGDLVVGMQKTDFIVTGGDRTDLPDLLPIKDGEYNLTLDTNGNDRNLDVAAHPPGFLRSAALPTGTLSVYPTDLRSIPLAVAYPLKVTVESTTGEPVSGATVTWRNLNRDENPGNGSTHYFATTSMLAGEIAVTAPGYEPFSTDVNTAVRNVSAGVLQQTHVKLSGTAPCEGSTETASGTTVTCAGLKPLPGTSTSSTPGVTAGPKPVSFTFPTTTRNTGASRPNPAPTLPPGPPCDASAVPAADTYTKAVEQVASDELVRLCMDQSSASGVERVDVSLGLDAQRVELHVAPASAFKAEWSADGVDAPPGDYHFGFLTVGLRVDGEAWTGPVQATTFRFHVSRAQLAEAGLRADDVQVYRWDGEAWEAVPTAVDTQTESDYAFSASAPGQGLFAVSGVAAVDAPVTSIWPWLVGGLVAVALIGIGVATAVHRHHVHEVPVTPPPPSAPAQPPPKGPVPFIK